MRANTTHHSLHYQRTICDTENDEKKRRQRHFKINRNRYKFSGDQQSTDHSQWHSTHSHATGEFDIMTHSIDFCSLVKLCMCMCGEVLKWQKPIKLSRHFFTRIHRLSHRHMHLSIRRKFIRQITLNHHLPIHNIKIRLV